MIKRIKLGNKVRCKYTGFEGIAVAKTEFINGCIQYTIAPKVDKDGKMQEEFGIDEESLSIIDTDIDIDNDEEIQYTKHTGGKSNKITKRRGF